VIDSEYFQGLVFAVSDSFVSATHDKTKPGRNPIIAYAPIRGRTPDFIIDMVGGLEGVPPMEREEPRVHCRRMPGVVQW
jgi:hypothetical protein